VTQTFSHLVRGVYFGTLAGTGELTATMWAPAIVLSILGAMMAPYVVERMSDAGFRQWTRAIIFIIAVVYLVRGGVLLWQGG
jgi:uncharacterized membrane protein YfcA